MSQDFFYIGSGPFDAITASPGDPDFSQKNRAECHAYADLIHRTHGKPPGDAFLSIKTNSDNYREVIVTFNSDHPAEAAYATLVESGLPVWDDLALEQIAAEITKS
jgi:hypothetical protein